MDEKARQGMYFISALGLVEALTNHIKEHKQAVEEGRADFSAAIISIELKAGALPMDMRWLLDRLPKKEGS